MKRMNTMDDRNNIWNNNNQLPEGWGGSNLPDNWGNQSTGINSNDRPETNSSNSNHNNNNPVDLNNFADKAKSGLGMLSGAAYKVGDAAKSAAGNVVDFAKSDEVKERINTVKNKADSLTEKAKISENSSLSEIPEEENTYIDLDNTSSIDTLETSDDTILAEQATDALENTYTPEPVISDNTDTVVLPESPAIEKQNAAQQPHEQPPIQQSNYTDKTQYTGSYNTPSQPYDTSYQTQNTPPPTQYQNYSSPPQYNYNAPQPVQQQSDFQRYQEPKKSYAIAILLAVIVILLLGIAVIGLLFLNKGKKAGNDGVSSVSDTVETTVADSTISENKTESTENDSSVNADVLVFDSIANAIYKATNVAVTELEEEGYEIGKQSFIISSDTEYYFNTELNKFDSGLIIQKMNKYLGSDTTNYIEQNSTKWFIMFNDGAVAFDAVSDSWDNTEAVACSAIIKLSYLKPKQNDKQSLSDIYQKVKNLDLDNYESTSEDITSELTQDNNISSIDYHSDHRSGAGSDFVFAENDGAGGLIATESDALNLRAKPDVNAEIIAKMPKDSSVGIFGSNSDWYYIHYTENGTSYYGYASRQYVRNLQVEAKTGIVPIEQYGTIYSPSGAKVDGYARSYIIDGGPESYIRHDLTHGWHIKAVNKYSTNTVEWYELYDADDGDYYGWVSNQSISFY